MELRHLRYFIAAAEESTIVAAAKRLHLAQPALTRQIHDLEREIGVELFDRTARGVELTPAGDVCLVSARHILRQVDVAMSRARGSMRGLVGRCVICVGARGLSSGFIARIATRLQTEYPGIELSIAEATTARQWKMLQTREADIGLGVVAPASYHDLSSEVFDHDIFDSIIVSSEHPLAKQKSVKILDLQNETLVTWIPNVMLEFDRQMRAEFKRIGFKITKRRDCTEIAEVLALVSAGQGWSFFPSKFPSLAISGTKVVPFSDFLVPLTHAFITRRDEDRPVIRTVVNVIRRLAAEEREAEGRAPLSERAARVSGAYTKVAEGDAGAASIELRHLRYYCAVVEARSFGRAAERLELTQPALSRQIRDLERAVGIELLVRVARGATPTPGGESFHESARRILDEASALPAEAHRARRGMLASCVIGTIPTQQARALLADLVRRCAKEVPEFQLSVEDHATPRQPAALRAARIDLGICHASPMSSVEQRGLRRERLYNDTLNCALVPANSAFAEQKELSLQELAEFPFYFVARAFQPAMYDEVFSIFGGHNFVPRVEATYDGLLTLWTMVAQGHGWSIGFASQCGDPPKGTVAVPIRDFSLAWGIDVMVRSDEARTMILLLMDMLHDIAHGPADEALPL